MSERVLVTGGSGFIGQHVTRALLEHGLEVRVLDAFIDQVHGNGAKRHSLAGAEVVQGDVRDREAVRSALEGVDAVVHLAAEVGVGQSMYEIERYVDVNERGTGVLFDELVRRPVRRVVVASSMSVYGEGLYVDEEGNEAEPETRSPRRGSWEPRGAGGRPLRPVATPEWKRPALASVYALGKYAQEQMALIVSPAYGMEACALRLFNVFGPGQALSNPYTGVLAIFASRLLNGEPPLVYEDGRQRRDFVHVEDVARAFVLALDGAEAPGRTFNIGSGRSYDILGVAQSLASAMGRSEIEPVVLEKARVGDIRHCFADIGLAEEKLGYRPRRRLDETTLAELAHWVAQSKAVDKVSHAQRELETRGLLA